MSRCERAEDVDQTMVRFEGVAKRSIQVDLIAISPTHFGARDVPSVDEVVNDPVHCSLPDADEVSNVGQPDFTILCDTHQYVPVIGEERP
jgi:hypothetical protein